MRSALSTVLVFLAVLAVGVVGLRLRHPERSMEELVRGDGDEEETTWEGRAVVEAGADPAADCLAVPQRMVDYLQSHLHPAGEVTLRLPRAYWAGSFVRPYVIAAELDGEGLESGGDVATWSATSLTPGDGVEVKAEDDLASRWSDLPDGRATDAWERDLFEASLFLAGECVRAEERG